ncbi:MAG: IS3 family transposase [Clostridia bacterium]|nr:IS3 family transposase [Clostridia bacterium]
MQVLSDDEGYNVTNLCAEMHVSRSGYYKWLKRDNSPGKLRREKIVQLVKELHDAHPSHGYRWVAEYLKLHNDVTCSYNLIYKVFKYLGIHAENTHQTKHVPRKEKDKYPNLIFSTWETVDRPREVIVSDMTVLRSKGGFIEVTFYFDVFTKQILTYKIGAKRGDRNPYIDGLKDLICIFETEGCTQSVYLHTDQGSVYASKEYNEIIKDQNITRSMSRAGKPTDNPVNEALNGWIKDELYVDFKFGECRSRWEMEELLKEFVKYYNEDRPCYALGFYTPNNYYKSYMDGTLERRNTFENRELTHEPKFVQDRKAASKAAAANDDSSEPAKTEGLDVSEGSENSET